MTEKTPFKGILLVCDMDGTLLDSKKQISRQNREAVKYFVEKGGRFTIATGRMDLGIAQYMPQLPVNAPVILYNGSLIYDFDKKERLWYKLLPTDVRNVLIHLMEKFPQMGIEVFHGGQMILLKENDITDMHLKRAEFFPRRATIEEVPDGWYKVILAWEHEKLEEVEKYILENIINEESPFYVVYSEPFFLEILSKEASKGRALKELIQMLQISRSKVIAVGDNMNDIDMIEVAGIGIAVENAHEQLKKVADYCFPDNDNHAVSKIVEWLDKKVTNYSQIICK
ncbi:MAG TPA: HAD family phosphatase [Clostridiaceae bacterium]|nr:HAD family phosphatase [Clostridiaceae bacterium]